MLATDNKNLTDTIRTSLKRAKKKKKVILNTAMQVQQWNSGIAVST